MHFHGCLLYSVFQSFPTDIRSQQSASLPEMYGSNNHNVIFHLHCVSKFPASRIHPQSHTASSYRPRESHCSIYSPVHLPICLAWAYFHPVLQKYLLLFPPLLYQIQLQKNFGKSHRSEHSVHFFYTVPNRLHSPANLCLRSLFSWRNHCPQAGYFWSLPQL